VPLRHDGAITCLLHRKGDMDMEKRGLFYLLIKLASP
jgi:hypothetical protein